MRKTARGAIKIAPNAAFKTNLLEIKITFHIDERFKPLDRATLHLNKPNNSFKYGK